ncbi:hypothetical protein PGTUg99_011657 [Puccinia graminis f. sp. tritici]|uniref:Uncharacterized protein n=1 Tax=Puccinia graminis f. sp. tritici TaxID=56615 RepID=A0A5B0PHJ7_PUCGR|nr:hypothetical protein PGTUg99_011657 [Puccinia graminis f. sp. tritici]
MPWNNIHPTDAARFRTGQPPLEDWRMNAVTTQYDCRAWIQKQFFIRGSSVTEMKRVYSARKLEQPGSESNRPRSSA